MLGVCGAERDLAQCKPSASDLAVLCGLWRRHPRYQSCIGHWLMGEAGGLTVSDSSIYGNHGTRVNGPTTIVERRGMTLNFAGGTDYVSIANPTRFNIGGADWTLSAWVKPTNLTADRFIFMKTDSAAWAVGGKAWYAISTTGKQTLDCNPVGFVFSNTTVPTGVLSHLAVSFDNTSNLVSFFFNGIPDGSGTFALNADDAAHVIKVGMSGGGGGPFLGPMEDLRFYQRLLSPGDIASLYVEPFLEFTDAYQLPWGPWSAPVALFQRFVPPARQYYQAVNRASRF